VSDREIFEALVEAKHNGESVALAIITRDQGSVPRHAGTKMLVYPDGSIKGTIGGGEMESRVIAAALEALASGESASLHYEMSEPERGDPGVCGGQMDVYLEPIMPDPTVLVVGCGHVGQALAELAHWLGFHVVATDDRADLCTPENVPHADELICTPPAEVAEKAPIHRRTYIAAVTRGVPFDVVMLPALLATPAPYIGVMGSRRRWATAAKQLREEGMSEADLARVHAPIGFELKAETPREIAVSIMAEILAHHYGASGEPMKWMGTPEEAR
jgi:xanthine dehydrogenase accessory factor